MPIRYEYLRRGAVRNIKHEASLYDWAAGVARHESAGHGKARSPLAPGTQDRLSWQFQLRQDMARALARTDMTQGFSYLIADEEKRKRYEFRYLGEETLQTPAGELRTLRLGRVHDDDRRTTFWLAADHACLLVKMEQVDGKRGFELRLVSFVFEQP